MRRKQAHAAARSAVATGNTTHTLAVVVHSSHSACHVCSVVVWIHVIAVGAEVPSVNVVDIAVAVVVNARRTVKLCFVDEHIGGEVFVSVVDTTIDDCHNHVFLAGSGFPRLKQVDVGTGTAARNGACVVVVPLA